MRDCFLSESVTRAALRRLQPQLEAHQLHLVTKGASIDLTGTEISFRRFLADLVGPAMDVLVGQEEKLARHLPDVDLSEVSEILASLLAQHCIEIDDIRFETAVTNLAICLHRRDFPMESEPTAQLILGTEPLKLCEELIA